MHLVLLASTSSIYMLCQQTSVEMLMHNDNKRSVSILKHVQTHADASLVMQLVTRCAVPCAPLDVIAKEPQRTIVLHVCMRVCVRVLVCMRELCMRGNACFIHKHGRADVRAYIHAFIPTHMHTYT
jgi:hypothetical protein